MFLFEASFYASGKGAGLTALETEVLYLSTEQIQRGQRQWQWQLPPRCPHPVPER